jgi:hypothetical protein
MFQKQQQSIRGFFSFIYIFSFFFFLFICIFFSSFSPPFPIKSVKVSPHRVEAEPIVERSSSSSSSIVFTYLKNGRIAA